MKTSQTVSAYSSRAESFTASEIRELLKLLERPEVISFAGGVPDPNFFPTPDIKSAIATLMGSEDFAARHLQYAVSEGNASLRSWIADYMNRKGGDFAPSDIVITNGAQQALDFVGRLFIDKGDKVAVCNPTYLGALQVFSHYEPNFVGVTMDANGPCVETLEEALRTRPKFFYINTNFGNPNGVLVSEQRRREILELAVRYDVVIVEDGAYDELYFDVPPPPSLANLAQTGDPKWLGRVVYCGTFSKTIAPALRIGWMAASRSIIEKAVLIKQAADLHCSPLAQSVADQIARTAFDEHNAKLRNVYRKRRDAMAAALNSEIGNFANFEIPNGGFFFWLSLPSKFDTTELLKTALAEEHVAYVPGGAFFWNRAERHHLRLSFSLGTEEAIGDGVSRLARVVKAHL